MKLKDKIAIVTGAGQGLGRAIALMLGEEGAVVAVVGRTTSKLEFVVAEITQAGGRAWPITADLTEEDQVQGMVDQVMEKYGRIDVLVNNAGGYPKEMYDISTQSPLKIWDWKPEQWDQIIRTNLRIPFLCMNKVTPVMRDQGFGDIVSVSSRMGRIASEMGAYAVAKGGIVTLTKTAAIQMKEYGVRCNAVAPTIVDTPGQRVYNTSVGQDGIQMGDARHVALAVRYLLCDAPPVMTGQVMDLFTTLSLGIKEGCACAMDQTPMPSIPTLPSNGCVLSKMSSPVPASK